jgi:hypothetical protein
MFPFPYDTELVAAHHRELRAEAEARRLIRRSKPRRPRRRLLGIRR